LVLYIRKIYENVFPFYACSVFEIKEKTLLCHQKYKTNVNMVLLFYVPEEELDNLWSKLNMDRDVGLDYLDFRRIMKRGSASFLN
jgi:hypothetical protein